MIMHVVQHFDDHRIGMMSFSGDPGRTSLMYRHDGYEHELQASYALLSFVIRLAVT